MKIYEEITAQDYIERAWSGARDTIASMSVEEVQTVLDILEESAGEEGESLTSVNDFFWFERDTIAEWLGFPSWEKFERGDSFGIEELDSDELEEVRERYAIENERDADSVSDSELFEEYAGVDFVNDDFFCNC